MVEKHFKNPIKREKTPDKITPAHVAPTTAWRKQVTELIAAYIIKHGINLPDLASICKIDDATLLSTTEGTSMMQAGTIAKVLDGLSQICEDNDDYPDFLQSIEGAKLILTLSRTLDKKSR